MAKRTQFRVSTILWLTLSIAFLSGWIGQTIALRRNTVEHQRQLAENVLANFELQTEMQRQRDLMDHELKQQAFELKMRYQQRVCTMYPEAARSIALSPPHGAKFDPTLDNLKFARLLGEIEIYRLTRGDLTAFESEELLRHRTLKTICLTGATVTPDFLARLETHPNLVRLNLRHCQLTDHHLESIATISNLKSLELSHNPQITDDAISHLTSMPNLLELELHQTKLTNEAAVHLRECKRLQRIRIDKTKMDEKAVALIKQSLPACQVVDWHLYSLPLPRWYE